MVMRQLLLVSHDRVHLHSIHANVWHDLFQGWSCSKVRKWRTTDRTTAVLNTVAHTNNRTYCANGRKGTKDIYYDQICDAKANIYRQCRYGGIKRLLLTLRWKTRDGICRILQTEIYIFSDCKYQGDCLFQFLRAYNLNTSNGVPNWLIYLKSYWLFQQVLW